MKDIQLLHAVPGDIPAFKRDVQEAFQKGFEDHFGKTDGTILPERDIDQSLNAPGAIAYKAVVDGRMVGGAVVVIDEEKKHGDLHLLYVKCGCQNGGVGKAIWFEIERLHPDIRVWETCTPYFERRNIHFYVNVCGFHIVEFLNERHPGPGEPPEDFIGDGNEGMFEFRKEM